MTVRWLDFDPDTGRLRLDSCPAAERRAPGWSRSAARATRSARSTTSRRSSPRSAPPRTRWSSSTRSSSCPHLPIDVARARLRSARLLALQVVRPAPGRAVVPRRPRRAHPRLQGPPRRDRRRAPVRDRDAVVRGAGGRSPRRSTISPGSAARSRPTRPPAANGSSPRCDAATAYERDLGERLLAGLSRLNSVRLYGPRDDGRAASRPSPSRSRATTRTRSRGIWPSAASSPGRATSTRSR